MTIQFLIRSPRPMSGVLVKSGVFVRERELLKAEVIAVIGRIEPRLSHYANLPNERP